MTTARKSVVPASGAGVFHCISRCVRRAWLCGVDPLTGRDFSHRKHLRIWESDPAKVAEWRQRMGSVSWLMRCLNEPLARRANQEDKCKGRFWEGRFKCQGLCDMGAVLACMTYVDLNPVRAGLAATPEESEFTSVRERFAAEVARRGNERTAKEMGRKWFCRGAGAEDAYRMTGKATM